MLLAMLAKKFMKFFKSTKKTSKTPYLDLSKDDSQGLTQWKKERPKKSFEVIYIYIYTLHIMLRNFRSFDELYCLRLYYLLHIM
jgi:RecA-family ATPase